MLTFLKSERTIDYLRWIAAFAAGLRRPSATRAITRCPCGPQAKTVEVQATASIEQAPSRTARVAIIGATSLDGRIEINLPDMPQRSAIPPSDRASEPAISANPTGDNTKSNLFDSADTAPRLAGASVSRADAARNADTDAKYGSPDAPMTAA